MTDDIEIIDIAERLDAIDAKLDYAIEMLMANLSTSTAEYVAKQHVQHKLDMTHKISMAQRETLAAIAKGTH